MSHQKLLSRAKSEYNDASIRSNTIPNVTRVFVSTVWLCLLPFIASSHSLMLKAKGFVTMRHMCWVGLGDHTVRYRIPVRSP